MDFICYHRDRTGSMTLRYELLEQHLDYMDQFNAAMVARGPTFLEDGTLTGSVHILDLPDPDAARSFAFNEPGYQAGIYRDVLLRRWHNVLGKTMWDYAGEPDGSRYFVLGFTSEPWPGDAPWSFDERFIASGPLLSDDGTRMLGVAALLTAANSEAAGEALVGGHYDGIEVHQWRQGGRSA